MLFYFICASPDRIIAKRAERGPIISNTTDVAATTVTIRVPTSGYPNSESLLEAIKDKPIATPACESIPKPILFLITGSAFDARAAR